MSRERQKRLWVNYHSDLDRVSFKYSKRGIEGMIGVEVVPGIILGVSPQGRVINWHIDNPRDILADYLEDTHEEIRLKPQFQWKKMLDQQRIQHLIDSPIQNVNAFLSTWIINLKYFDYGR